MLLPTLRSDRSPVNTEASMITSKHLGNYAVIIPKALAHIDRLSPHFYLTLYRSRISCDVFPYMKSFMFSSVARDGAIEASQTAASSRVKADIVSVW